MTQTIFIATLTILILALIIISLLLYQHIKRENKILRAMEQKSLEHEVSILKNQMSPHFILNTINNIGVLMDADMDRSKNLLFKFGDLLRYSTYEVGSHKVKLSRTLDYLEKYIELQHLRFRDKRTIHFSVQGTSENKYIAPMILLPFIENAFKYGKHNDEEKPSIQIDLRISENSLWLYVRNRVKKRPIKTENGIGIQNTTKRLEMIYPNQHSLDIYNDGDQFIVKLKINDLKNGKENQVYRN
jgi:LytS/YehU family sensor histidine kinase